MATSGKEWLCRPYRPSDKEACLKVFDSNTTPPFLSEERLDFARYLDQGPDPYFVIENEKGIPVACGGYSVGPDGESASLCWGMVGKEWHGLGLGRRLLSHRLAALAQVSGVKLIRLDTGQDSAGFFVKLGFKTYRITRDHYGPGLHRYEMYLLLDEETRKRLYGISA